MLYFTGEVLAAQECYTELLGLIRDRWSDMLDRGATSTWETFQGFTDTRMLGMWSRSWCHAWSASPAYLLSRYIMGISPLEPGYQKALIEPQLCDLIWVEGKMPTPMGTIGLHAERETDKFVLRVNLPAGVPAQVRLPAGKKRSPSVSGTAASSYRQEGDQWILELPASAVSTIIIFN
jgi:alpha-L-rhamnosidase